MFAVGIENLCPQVGSTGGPCRAVNIKNSMWEEKKGLNNYTRTGCTQRAGYLYPPQQLRIKPTS